MLNVSRQRKCSGCAQSAAYEHRNHRLDSNDLCRLTWRHFNIFNIHTQYLLWSVGHREDIVSSYNAVLATQNALKMLRMPPRIVEAKRPSFLTNQQSDKLTLKQAAVAARVRWKQGNGGNGYG